jgi:hypothetical protein
VHNVHQRFHPVVLTQKLDRLDVLAGIGIHL